MRAGLLCGAGVLVGLALFFGGGSTYGPLVWLGTIAIAAAGILFVLASLGRLPWPALDRAGTVFLVLLAALAVWTGVSVSWSVAHEISWEYFKRGIVYLAFLVVGLFVGAAFGVRTVASGFAILLAAVMAWALAGKVVPNVFPDGARIARLRDPIEYWNGLALIAAMAMPLGLWHAVRREHPRLVRVGGVALLYLAGLTLLMTYSRGGVLVALAALGVSLILLPQRVEAVAAGGRDGRGVGVHRARRLVGSPVLRRAAARRDPVRDRAGLHRRGAEPGDARAPRARAPLAAEDSLGAVGAPARRRRRRRRPARGAARERRAPGRLGGRRLGRVHQPDQHGGNGAGAHREPQPQQPLDLVGGGVGDLHRPCRGGSGRRDVRDRAASHPHAPDVRDRAAQPSAAVSGRDRLGRLPTLRRRPCRRPARGGPGDPQARRSRGRRGLGALRRRPGLPPPRDDRLRLGLRRAHGAGAGGARSDRGHAATCPGASAMAAGRGARARNPYPGLLARRALAGGAEDRRRVCRDRPQRSSRGARPV